MFRDTGGSTEHCPLVLGVETGVGTIAAKKAGNWYRGVLDAAERFMVWWHKDAADMIRTHHASAVGGAQRNAKGGGYSRKDTAVGESRKDTADRVARYQADK